MQIEKARNVTWVTFSVKVAIWPLCIIVVWYTTYSEDRSLVRNTRSRRISNGIASGTIDGTSDLRTRLNMQIFRNQVLLWLPVGVVLDYALVNAQLTCFPQAGIPKDILCLFQSFHWPLSPSGKVEVICEHKLQISKGNWLNIALPLGQFSNDGRKYLYDCDCFA